MILSPSANRTRLAIDNRVSRDLIAQARKQGFVFSDPPADYPIWQQVETADLENPAFDCSPDVSDWLFGRAIEATLFQLYLQKRLSRAMTQTDTTLMP